LAPEDNLGGQLIASATLSLTCIGERFIVRPMRSSGTTPSQSYPLEPQRFPFGRNWRQFLRLLSEARIQGAEESLRSSLGIPDLSGKRFLDIGSGSGLFSLAARRLGADVHSFDYDADSVECTEELRRRYFPGDGRWRVERGSILDSGYVGNLGQFDVVYAWGVLHHTGDLHSACRHAASLVAAPGALLISVYNDQGLMSRYWAWAKRTYNRGLPFSAVLVAIHAPYLVGVRWMVRALQARTALSRGMSFWYDMIDWLGGYPFQVARPEEVFRLLRSEGLDLEGFRTCGGRLGCNEFLFRRADSRAASSACP
jgi:2-polyprenyl-6-hydroxyphenyl methylase/3-demethylubiquinone-9 3-methyltransferase